MEAFAYSDTGCLTGYKPIMQKGIAAFAEEFLMNVMEQQELTPVAQRGGAV